MKMNVTVVITVNEDNVLAVNEMVDLFRQNLEFGIAEYDPYYNFDVAVDKAKD